MNTSVVSTGKRMKAMDALKLFAIFMVLWGHAIQHMVSTSRFESPVWIFIYSFHMPLFMMVSGFFGASLTKYSFRDCLVKKSRQLLLPALSFGIICCVLDIVHGGGVREMAYTLYASFWFLKSAFLCAIFYYIGFKHPRFRLLGLCVTLLISQGIPCWQFNLMYPCFLVGVLVSAYQKQFIAKSNSIALVTGIVFVGLLVFWIDGRFLNTTGSGLSLSSLSLATALDYMLRHVYKVVIGCVGSVFFMSLFLSVGKRIPESRVGDVLCRWGTYTLGIYVLQTFVLEMFVRAYFNCDGMNFYLFHFVVTPLVSVVVLLVCILIINMIHRSRVASLWLLGEKR